MEQPPKRDRSTASSPTYSAPMSSAADRRKRSSEGLPAAALEARSCGRPADRGRQRPLGCEIAPLIEAGSATSAKSRAGGARRMAGNPRPSSHIRLHEIGQLRSNKAADAVSCSSHPSLDRRSLLDAPGEGSRQGRSRPAGLCPGQYRRGGAEGRLSDRWGRRARGCRPRLAIAAGRADGNSAAGRRAAPISRCSPNLRDSMT